MAEQRLYLVSYAETHQPQLTDKISYIFTKDSTLDDAINLRVACLIELTPQEEEKMRADKDSHLEPRRASAALRREVFARVKMAAFHLGPPSHQVEELMDEERELLPPGNHEIPFGITARRDLGIIDQLAIPLVLVGQGGQRREITINNDVIGVGYIDMKNPQVFTLTHALCIRSGITNEMLPDIFNILAGAT